MVSGTRRGTTKLPRYIGVTLDIIEEKVALDIEKHVLPVHDRSDRRGTAIMRHELAGRRVNQGGSDPERCWKPIAVEQPVMGVEFAKREQLN